ncbi:N-6 DNA methylase [Actinomadura pelletieri DSM 43383]|uniref:N-6 DNA methylase n=2 Tax=Actinomadura pelletieri TaxID=111805 RepID=A0A495QXE3_9ACTN|nr:N-6 DNA methylase [Actinomadura pelletieri DSM 43383]
MADTGDTGVSVNLAEIARIAGVGRAAVSNWRRRHTSFPSPVGGTDRSPQFSLPDIEHWLLENGKISAGAGAKQGLWPRFELLGDRDAMGRVIAGLGYRLTKMSSGTVPEVELSLQERELLDASVTLARRGGEREIFDFLVERWLGAHVRQLSATPERLSELFVDIADLCVDGPVRTVLDPACGTGALLVAAARRWTPASMIGQDVDAVPAAVTAARLRFSGGDRLSSVEVTVGDSVRDGVPGGADVIVCSPPTNERSWAQAEPATDPRWIYGLPPRSESELAWIQIILGALRPGGTGVVLLPPAVAVRRAGRRIRREMLRGGAIRSIIALPVGAAPPHSVGLHIWLVRRPADEPPPADDVLMIDTADCRVPLSNGRYEVDWDAVRERVTSGVRDGKGPGVQSVPVMDLLDEQVDLSPARHVPPSDTTVDSDLREEWIAFNSSLDRIVGLSRSLSTMPVVSTGAPVNVTVAELHRAGALSFVHGKAVPEHLLHRGERPSSGIRVLTLADLLPGSGPGQWIDDTELEELKNAGDITITEPQDVIVVSATRAFDAWVELAAPMVLGPQLTALRPTVGQLDPWYLAGSLRTSANLRRAGGHASTTSRVDLSRLEIRRLPLQEQQKLGDVFRRLMTFETSLAELSNVGTDLGRTLSDLLAAGRLTPH